jgi:hypothetical protein
MVRDLGRRQAEEQCLYLEAAEPCVIEKQDLLSKLCGFNRSTRPPPSYIGVICSRRLVPQGFIE